MIMKRILKKALLSFLVAIISLWQLPVVVNAQENIEATKTEYSLAEVISIAPSDINLYNNTTVIDVTAKIIEGFESGKKVTFNYSNSSIKDSTQFLETGEKIYVSKSTDPDGTVTYNFHEKYRLPTLLIFTILFFVVVLVFAGFKGLSALSGLVFSILVLIGFVVPRILAGDSPLLITLFGVLLIGFVSFYLAHGFKKKTTVALLATFAALAIGGILTITFTFLAKFTGASSEEALFLKAQFAGIDLRGLLLSGVIFGVLGVLDDVTISQVSAVIELKKANKALSLKELYQSAANIGKDHVASMVNTLVLAYVSSSLALLLFFSLNKDVPVLVILNEEFVSLEIMRSIIGSLAIVLAVPIATVFGAYAVSKWPKMAEGSAEHKH